MCTFESGVQKVILVYILLLRIPPKKINIAVVTSSFLCVLNYVWLCRLRNGIRKTKTKIRLSSKTSEKDQSDLLELCSPKSKDKKFSLVASIYSTFYLKYPQAGQNWLVAGGSEI